jgi:hypothetical protein
MLLIASRTFWPSARTPITTSSEIAVKDPASHFAVVNYLQRSPRPAAKAALQSLTD